MHSSKVIVKQMVKVEAEAEVEIQPYDFAKLLSPEQFALLLTGRCNSYDAEYESGRKVGKLLQSEHRTLQATAFRYLLGICVGISDDVEYTDARNEVAVASGKKLGKMIYNNELKIGYMI